MTDTEKRLTRRIAELESALRALLRHDDERFGFEGEPSPVEERCRRVLDKKQKELPFFAEPVK